MDDQIKADLRDVVRSIQRASYDHPEDIHWCLEQLANVVASIYERVVVLESDETDTSLDELRGYFNNGTEVIIDKEK